MFKNIRLSTLKFPLKGLGGVTIALFAYVIYFGLIGDVPRRAILNESIRNLYFHVPLWFAMILLLTVSAFNAIKYLQKGDETLDIQSVEYANVALIFGILGCATGAVWANYTWGDPWPNDPKLNGVAVGMLMYAAYFVLRSSFDDEQRKARISAIYNILAYAIFIPLIAVLPRLTDSLHPGNGGNPAFGQYDMNNQMRLVFYPAVIAFMLLGLWIGSLRIRIRKIENKL